MKKYKYLGLAVVLLATVLGYFPVIAYWAYKAGLWNGPSRSFLPAELVERSDWFPIVASDSAVGKLVWGQKNLPPSVVYQKVNYVAPWVANRIMVSSFRLPHDSDVTSVFSGRLKLPWGSVDLVRPEVSRAGEYRLALEKELGIAFFYKDPQDLFAFESVRLNNSKESKGPS